MSRAGRTGWALTAALLLSISVGLAVGAAQARQVVPDDPTAGVAVVGEAPAPGGPTLPPQIQVVRLSGPLGMGIEVLEPAPMVLSDPNDDPAIHGLTVGLQVGVGYRLRLTNLPNQPGAEVFPVVEVVGHLHRPADIDPTRFPIRVIFSQEDLIDVAESGRLVTQIVYLESPDQALPLSIPKDQIPVTTLGPGEEPLRVAGALGRVMAIVRLGGRTPVSGEPLGGFGAAHLGVGPCPFEATEGVCCGVPTCPPASFGLAPNPVFPGDEYLCDGGDHQNKAGIGADGQVVGVEPRDAMIRFNAGSKPRVLPTNTVCIYAPRFAAVRTSIGVNENRLITVPRGAEALTRQMQEATVRPPSRMTQNLSANAVRDRRRASAMEGRTPPITHIEVRVLNGLTDVVALDQEELVQGPQVSVNEQGPRISRRATPPLGIKTAEGPVITGVIQGASQTIVSRGPGELAGVETPPDLPGLAVNKETDTDVAEPGQVVTFTIRWRNMGNVPIHSVSIVDSLLPRFEYEPDSARGPDGAIFTAAENQTGSVELRWDLPEPVMPGEEGSVSFKARVR
ncbi:DUF11 domain-containing protein [Tautonia sp. JC769]|uniref:DUF11 domain-containing protein n=1 Tax=Tautonia sp. JC769 TaxID=3232135 RepID=UPI00345984F9